MSYQIELKLKKVKILKNIFCVVEFFVMILTIISMPLCYQCGLCDNVSQSCSISIEFLLSVLGLYFLLGLVVHYSKLIQQYEKQIIVENGE